MRTLAKKFPEFPENSRILTFAYDAGKRYLPVKGLY